MNTDSILTWDLGKDEAEEEEDQAPAPVTIPLAELVRPNRAMRRAMARQVGGDQSRTTAHCVRCGFGFTGPMRCQCKTSKIQHVLVRQAL
jgi:hypothetical protein